MPFKKSGAFMGHPTRTRLGAIYNAGDGVPEDHVQAYVWWSFAVAQGYKNASGKKGIVRKDMTAEQIAEAEKLSKTLCAKIPNCAR